jgi:hypothetical protein
VFPISEDFNGRLPSPVVPGSSVAVSSDGKTLRYGADPDEALAKADAAGQAAAGALAKAAAAQDTADTALANAAVADGKAVAAQDTADTAVGLANSITVGGREAIAASSVNKATTVRLNINPSDRVLSQSSAGLLASLGLVYAGDAITLVGQNGAALGAADIGWISGLVRQSIADSSNILAMLSTDEAWTLDSAGGLMPRNDAAESLAWAMDESGDFMPQGSAGETFFWTGDGAEDLMPKTGGIS